MYMVTDDDYGEAEVSKPRIALGRRASKQALGDE